MPAQCRHGRLKASSTRLGLPVDLQTDLHLARGVRLTGYDSEVCVVQVAIGHRKDNAVEQIERFAAKIDTAIFTETEALGDADVLVHIPRSTLFGIEFRRVAVLQDGLRGKLI